MSLRTLRALLPMCEVLWYQSTLTPAGLLSGWYAKTARGDLVRLGFDLDAAVADATKIGPSFGA